MSRVDPDSFGPRWTPAMKAEIAHALIFRKMRVSEAYAKTGASREELAHWLRRYRHHGQVGLNVTKTQAFR